MAKVAGKIGGKRKIWFTKMILTTYPSGLIAGMTGDNSPNAAKEMKTGSSWKAGKSKNKYK
jgi:hypothetical protein